MSEIIKRLFSTTVVRFMMVGVVNTLVGYAIMFGAYNILHLSYWISSALNYTLGSILSFFLNKHFTFQSDGNTWEQALRFAGHIIVCYVAAYGLAKPLTLALLANSSLTVRDNVAMLVGSILFIVMNYLGQRFFAFRKKQSEETKDAG